MVVKRKKRGKNPKRINWRPNIGRIGRLLAMGLIIGSSAAFIADQARRMEDGRRNERAALAVCHWAYGDSPEAQQHERRLLDEGSGWFPLNPETLSHYRRSKARALSPENPKPRKYRRDEATGGPAVSDVAAGICSAPHVAAYRLNREFSDRAPFALWDPAADDISPVDLDRRTAQAKRQLQRSR